VFTHGESLISRGERKNKERSIPDKSGAPSPHYRRIHPLAASIIQAVAFTVNDIQDLLRLLREQPEWLGEVRRVVFTEELLALPRELAESQRRTDERFAELAEAIRQLTLRFEEAQRRNDERFAELAEFQRRAEARFAELTEAIKQLTLRFEEAQRRNDERFAELAEAIRQLTLRFEDAQRRNDNQFADIRGKLLEIEYRNKVGAIFGGRLRKPRVVDAGDVWDILRNRLDEAEIRRIVDADLIVRGGLLPAQDEGELWLVVEVSSVIDRNDVARAAERAALLRKADLLVVPVVAGQRLTQGAVTLAGEFGVAVARNGGLDGWDKALTKAGGSYSASE